MSIGYIPKRRAKIKRMRRARKKYKNFSCITCEKRHNVTCSKRYHLKSITTNFEYCPDWKAHKDTTLTEATVPDKKIP